MNWNTGVRDCLCLNWALPRDALPEVRPPLAYDARDWRDRQWVLASALLCRIERHRVESVALPRLSYPQLSLRLCVLDGDSVASFFLACVLTPPWAVPGARWVGRQPASRATFDFPPAGVALEAGGLRWEVRRRSRFAVLATPGSPVVGVGPDLGGFERTVAYVHQRRRSYFHAADGLRRLEVEPRTVGAVPVEATVESSELVSECLGIPDGDWPRLHSAWLWPEAAFLFASDETPDRVLPRRAPAPG